VIVWFFFSSRRRHTIFSRDWSSDVCSSDLRGHAAGQSLPVGREVGEVRLDLDALVLLLEQLDGLLVEVGAVLVAPPFEADGDRRAEERRVGNECGMREEDGQRADQNDQSRI